jgi:glutathione S-transferase
MKVEVYLKLMKVPYTTRLGNPRAAPKRKMPFIERDDGPPIADSTAILEHLESKQAEPLDGGMGELERARGHVIRRTFEEGLYFVALWSRWAEEAGWSVTRRFFDPIPAAVRWAVAPLIRKRVIATAYAQGTGRHTRDEIYAIGKRDLAAVAALLGDGPFFFGERMRTTDIVVHSFVANILKLDLETPLREEVRSRPNLVAFVDRMTQRVADAAKG